MWNLENIYNKNFSRQLRKIILIVCICLYFPSVRRCLLFIWYTLSTKRRPRFLAASEGKHLWILHGSFFSGYDRYIYKDLESSFVESSSPSLRARFILSQESSVCDLLRDVKPLVVILSLFLDSNIAERYHVLSSMMK